MINSLGFYLFGKENLLNMTYWVYIIQSDKDGTFYKGFTLNINKRLMFHNSGFSTYTRRKMPWKLVFAKKFFDNNEALKFEKRIKKWNTRTLKKLIRESNQEITSGI